MTEMENIIPYPTYNTDRTFAHDQAISEAWAKVLQFRRDGGIVFQEAVERYKRLLSL